VPFAVTETTVKEVVSFCEREAEEAVKLTFTNFDLLIPGVPEIVRDPESKDNQLSPPFGWNVTPRTTSDVEK
jgi:hypothetical protein